MILAIPVQLSVLILGEQSRWHHRLWAQLVVLWSLGSLYGHVLLLLALEMMVHCLERQSCLGLPFLSLHCLEINSERFRSRHGWIGIWLHKDNSHCSRISCKFWSCRRQKHRFYSSFAVFREQMSTYLRICKCHRAQNSYTFRFWIYAHMALKEWNCFPEGFQLIQ